MKYLMSWAGRYQYPTRDGFHHLISNGETKFSVFFVGGRDFRILDAACIRTTIVGTIELRSAKRSFDFDR